MGYEEAEEPGDLASGDLRTGVRGLQFQVGEMRDFLEVQFSLQRQLLDRLVTTADTTSVSPQLLGMRKSTWESLPSLREGSGESLAQNYESGVLTAIQENDKEVPQKDVKVLEDWSNFQLSQKAYTSQAQLRAQDLQTQQLRLATQAARGEFQKRNWRMFIKEIVFSPMFSLAITLLILINVILLGVEVDVSASMDLDEVPSWFGTVNAIIVVIFVIEMILKMFVLGRRDFWCGAERAWNSFDFIIVSVSVADLLLDVMASAMSSLDTGHLRFMRSIRMARAIRGVRVVRIFRYVTALRTLALSIIGTMSSLFWTLALLVLVFYLFSVVITQLVLDHCRHLGLHSTSICPEMLKKFWGSVPESAWVQGTPKTELFLI